MSGLNTAQRAMMAAAQARWYPDAAVIRTPAGTITDGQGGTLPGIPTDSDPIPCRSARRRGRTEEGIVGPQVQAISVWVITLQGVHAVQPTQQIVVTFLEPDGVTSRGTTLYEVSGPATPRSFGTETDVECTVVSSSGT
jgi:hypothetical protein